MSYPLKTLRWNILSCLALWTAAGLARAASAADAAEPTQSPKQLPPPSAAGPKPATEAQTGEQSTPPSVAGPKPEADTSSAAELDDDEADTGEAGGYRLPGGIHLGGMFDVAFERTDRSTDFTGGKNAFRSYHRLLFLSRQGDDIPIGFTAEVLNQYFYELNVRLSVPSSRLRVLAHAGKILVPFGPDPLFHKSYGGLTGTDQRLLPVVWSAIGAGVRLSYAGRRLSVADEVFAVQGFDLPSPDQTLNMQRDLAAYDGARIALGNRLALSSGPLTLWYSFYWNQMRFGRQLIMQAVDVSLWRPSLPVLHRFALGAGFARAHVSATDQWGQPGASLADSAYFHFGDYLWLRGYLTDGFYLQARSGLATFGNLTGLTYDEHQADARDSSHHSLALVFEYASARVMLAYYWNFEKTDERADDLLRLLVSYAF